MTHSSRKIVLALAALLVAELSLAPLAGAMSTSRYDPLDDTMAAWSIMGGIKDSLHWVSSNGCSLIENVDFHSASCGTVVSVAAAAGAVAGCAALTGATVGIAAAPCVASLAATQAIGMGVAQLDSHACTEGNLVEECLTAPWGGVKKAVSDTRSDDYQNQIGLGTLVAPIIDVGTTALPLYGAGGAVVGGTKAGAAIAKGGRVIEESAQVGKLAKMGRFAPVGLGQELGRTGDAMVAARSASSGFVDSTKTWAKGSWKFLTGGDAKIASETVAKTGAGLKEDVQLSKNIYANAGVKPGLFERAQQARFTARGATYEKIGSWAASDGKVATGLRGVTRATKAGRPVLEGLNARSSTAAAAAVVVTNGARTSTADTPPVYGPLCVPLVCPANGAGSSLPSGTSDGLGPGGSGLPPTGDARVTIQLLSPSTGDVFAHNDAISVSARFHAANGVRVWTAWINNHQVQGVGGRLDNAPNDYTASFVLNQQHADLVPGVYNITLRASDGVVEHDSSASVGIRVLTADGSSSNDQPGTSCTQDINGDHVPDCVDPMTNRIVPTPSGNGAVGAIIGLVILVAGGGFVAWRMTRG